MNANEINKLKQNGSRTKINKASIGKSEAKFNKLSKHSCL